MPPQFNLSPMYHKEMLSGTFLTLNNLSWTNSFKNKAGHMEQNTWSLLISHQHFAWSWFFFFSQREITFSHQSNTNRKKPNSNKIAVVDLGGIGGAGIATFISIQCCSFLTWAITTKM